MATASKTAKLVITSIVISIIVLAAFTLIFIRFIVPAYQITEDQIYSVLTKLFPVLIGLILIQIGVMAAKKGEPEYKETIDKLSPNAYDSALYTEPKDDPMLRGKVSPEVFGNASRADAQHAEAVREIIREVPVEVVKEVPVEVIKEVPVETIREVQVPVEIVKEVPVERVREVPVEVIKEIPVEKIIEKEIIREVPIEVIKEVEKEIPIEVEKEVEVPSEPAVVYLGFHDVLREETAAALASGYDLSLVAIKERAGLTSESIEAEFGEDTLVFDEDGCFYAILPLYSKEEAMTATETLEPRNVVSLEGKHLEPEEFIKEARNF